jgi:predicted dinucleotide-binding enzyme
VIDATNPVAMGSGLLDQGLLVGHESSAGERVAEWAAGARVVKAFNTIGWPIMANPLLTGGPAWLPICGDDPGAKAVVVSLAEELGFDACDVGPLRVARETEPFALLWIRLAFARGMGPHFAFRLSPSAS